MAQRPWGSLSDMDAPPTAVAVSDQMRGLYAHGRTYEELRRNTLDAVMAIWSAQGQGDALAAFVDEAEPNDFEPMEMRVRAGDRIAA